MEGGWVYVLVVLVVGVYSVGDLLLEPEVVDCRGAAEITLYVVEDRLTIDHQLTLTSRYYQYNGKTLPTGPTLRMFAGEVCNVTVVNTLTVPPCEHHLRNLLHCDQDTNLHTHGLHISYAQDNVSTLASPGEALHLSYHLLPHHIPGMHWYHSHRHGNTYLGLAGGQVGALEVVNENYVCPESLRRAYERNVTMVLQHYYVGGKVRIFEGLMNFQEAHAQLQTKPTFSFDPKLLNPDNDGNFVTVNGQFQPIVRVTAGEITVLRLINTSPLDIMELLIAKVDCDTRILARDGIYQPLPFLSFENIIIPQGGRVDVAIRCWNRKVPIIPIGSYPNATLDPLLGPHKHRFVQPIVFQIEVVEGHSMEHFPNETAPLSPYTPNMLSTVPIRKMELGLGVDGVNNILFQGMSLPGQYPPLQLGGVYEVHVVYVRHVEVTGDSHPYHQHAYPYQIVSSKDESGVVMRNGEFRDTSPQLDDDYGFVMRFIAADFTGYCIVHCHILLHEDNGMMTFFYVNPS